jgi:hypothetical protein
MVVLKMLQNINKTICYKYNKKTTLKVIKASISVQLKDFLMDCNIKTHVVKVSLILHRRQLPW